MTENPATPYEHTGSRKDPGSPALAAPESPTPDIWFVNGRSTAGYRIDAFGEKTGTDFLRGYIALVQDLDHAHLIAAAPELLDALVLLVECPASEHGHNWSASGKPGERFCSRCTVIYDSAWSAQARLAIRKARGS